MRFFKLKRVESFMTNIDWLAALVPEVREYVGDDRWAGVWSDGTLVRLAAEPTADAALLAVQEYVKRLEKRIEGLVREGYRYQKAAFREIEDRAHAESMLAIERAARERAEWMLRAVAGFDWESVPYEEMMAELATRFEKEHGP